MKQFQIVYKNDWTFCEDLGKIEQWRAENAAYATLFRIYSDDMDLGHIRHVCDLLDEKMPDALYLGCTSNANIIDGALTDANIILTCTVFERETTQIKVLQFPFLEENVKEDVRVLKEYCDANPWVGAVEMHATIMDMSMREFCDEMTSLRSDIQVFGGGAFNPDMDDETAAVFSKGNGFLEHGIVFLLLGGSDFHVYSTFISGWKPLTRRFTVTKADKEILYELNGEPAFNVYQKFLSIRRSDKFFSNTLEFPLFMDHSGIDLLRCPLAVNDDDSLVMSSDMVENATVRLAYGDPATILSSIRHDGQNIANFQPEIIQTFSCAARRAFWGDENISDETILFRSVAPTAGFYTHGEFIRIGGDMLNFNVTLVIAAMREGEPKNSEIVNISDSKLDNIESDRLPLIRRFVSFIETTTAELAIASITDGLTKLYNRAEIEKRIRSNVEELAQKETSCDLSLIMLDIDNFKRVNDVYGHKEGDRVIMTISDVLRKVIGEVESSAVGRWGGEEFMVMLPNVPMERAVELAERIRTEFSSISYETAGCQTVSLGVTQAVKGETADTLYTRVDKALYIAKYNGRNRTVQLVKTDE
ncbi:MAG: GGDEF domain-containing protein [Christensenellaceae bacterium]|nr:GGDEF domain-containing protein [Christensenellaceae bacterium]